MDADRGSQRCKDVLTLKMDRGGGRLPLLGIEDVAECDRDLVASGYHVHRVLAHSPGAARAVRSLAVYLRRESALNVRLRELVILQVCSLLRARYEYAHHLKLALEAGVSEADISAISEGRIDDFSDLCEQAHNALIAARELTCDFAISSDTFHRLRTQLGAAAVTDLVVLIATYSALAQIVEGLGITLEPEFEALLVRFPLP